MPPPPADGTEPEPSLARFRPLTAAEERIVGELSSGDFDRLGDGSRPSPGDEARRVRAALLRVLILGGEAGCRPHEKGLRVSGALIEGILDLEGCRVHRDIGLKDCFFEMVPVFRSAVVDSLFLDGSALPGLQADRLEARGGLYARAARITGEVRLEGARLGGSVELDGSDIAFAEGQAISADGLETRGGFLLRGAAVKGGVSLEGARIGRDFDAVGSRIDRAGHVALKADGLSTRGDIALRGAAIAGEVRLEGARVAGDVDCSGATLVEPDGFALRLDRAAVDGAFFLRQGAVVRGVLDLTATSFGAIDDTAECWPKPGDLRLNRCLYGAFIGGPVDAASRLDWLSRQRPERWGEDFWPQPYEQLAHAFREMGHDEDARAVLIEKERLQRAARRQRAGNPLWRAVLATKDAVLGATVLYGRQPLLAFFWLALFWCTGVAAFSWGSSRGAFKPNSPVVLRSLEWTMCDVPAGTARFMPSTERDVAGRAMPGETQLACFLRQPEAHSYPEFNAPMYSLDTMLPVLEIGQKEYWRPDANKAGGRFVLNYYYFQAVVGWALSLLAVAGFSGIVKSR